MKVYLTETMVVLAVCLVVLSYYFFCSLNSIIVIPRQPVFALTP